MFSLIIRFFLVNVVLSTPQVGYIYDSCTQNNNLNFTNSPGGTLYFSQYDRNHSWNDYGSMNYSYIYNCLVVLRGTSQGAFPYKRFFGIHFRLWNYDTNSGLRYDSNLTNLYFPNASANIKAVCGDACKTGCMQLIHPEYQTVVSLCNSNQLTGTDYTEYFSQDFLMLRFYLLGGIYNYENENRTNTVISRPTVNLIIDFFSFYFGKCVDSTNEFQCIHTDRCIAMDLKCDYYGGMDCGIVTGGSSISYDQSVCTQSSTVVVNITNTSYWLLFLLLCLPFLIMGLIFLFYRPGFCCWRCARLRNCYLCRKSSCCRKCSLLCVLGNSPKTCLCCRSAANSDDFSDVMTKGLCCCAQNEENSNNALYNSISKNKVFPSNSTSIDDEYANSNWTQYTLGDGYHLRECR